MIADLGNVTVGLENNPEHHKCAFCHCFCTPADTCRHCRFYSLSHAGRCYGELGVRSGDIGHLLRLASNQQGRPVEEHLIRRVTLFFGRFPFGSVDGMVGALGGLSPTDPINVIQSKMSALELRNYKIMSGKFNYDDCIFSGSDGHVTSIAAVAEDIINGVADVNLLVGMETSV